jgi:hypothetical protein
MEELSPAVSKLLARALEEPTHFGPLRRGHLESVAALFQVHPFVVSELREHLERPEVRQSVADQLLKTWRARRAASRVETAPRRAPPTVAALLEAVQATPGGPELFLNATAETVATVFEVHPFVVEAARAVATEHQEAVTPMPRPSSPFWLPSARA